MVGSAIGAASAATRRPISAGNVAHRPVGEQAALGGAASERDDRVVARIGGDPAVGRLDRRMFAFERLQKAAAAGHQ